MPASDIGAFIPVDTDPFEIIDNVLERPLNEPRSVRVFNAQNEPAPGVSSEEVGEEGRSQAADMQETGGARCESRCNRFHL